MEEEQSSGKAIGAVSAAPLYQWGDVEQWVSGLPGSCLYYTEYICPVLFTVFGIIKLIYEIAV